MDDGGWKAREGEGDRAPRPPFWPCSSLDLLSLCARPVPALGLDGVEMDAVGGGGVCRAFATAPGDPLVRARDSGARQCLATWASERTALKAPPSINVRVAGVAVLVGVREGER